MGRKGLNYKLIELSIGDRFYFGICPRNRIECIVTGEPVFFNDGKVGIPWTIAGKEKEPWADMVCALGEVLVSLV